MSGRADAVSVLCDAVESGRMADAVELAAQIVARYGEIKLGHENPWNRGQWDGHFVATDDCDTTAFENDADNILIVIACGESESGYDGDSQGIALLKDGRFVSWESSWGPTGSGFSADAYGGAADIAFSTTLAAATAFISEQGRELLRYAP